MKHNEPGYRRSALATLVLLLAVGALATTPLTLSKYAATAKDDSVKARLAKWAPQMNMSLAANWNKTVFMRSDGTYTWLAVNDLDPTDTVRRGNNWCFEIKPSNAGSEVTAKFTYEFRMADNSNVNGWLHIDPGGTTNGYYYTTGAALTTPRVPPGPDLVTMSDTLASGAASATGVPVYVYVNKGVRPTGYPTNCYAKVNFVWTATQVD